jgi:hypothetical protein
LPQPQVKGDGDAHGRSKAHDEGAPKWLSGFANG